MSGPFARAAQRLNAQATDLEAAATKIQSGAATIRAALGQIHDLYEGASDIGQHLANQASSAHSRTITALATVQQLITELKSAAARAATGRM